MREQQSLAQATARAKWYRGEVKRLEEELERPLNRRRRAFLEKRIERARQLADRYERAATGERTEASADVSEAAEASADVSEAELERKLRIADRMTDADVRPIRRRTPG